MRKKESIKKNIELTFDFVRYLVDNPEVVEEFPDKCEIDFVEKDFSSLTEKDLNKKKLIKVNRTFDVVKKRKSA
jgi:methionyl-tRNA synthetase